MKFVAVIGFGASGKSTIISSLTGCRRSSFKGFIEDKVSGNSIFVFSGAPQELGTSITDIESWMKDCKTRKGCNGMIMAIQPTKPNKRVSMENILKKAMVHGFEVFAFIIEPGYKNEYNGRYTDVPSSLKNVRVPKSNVFKVDGRRFSLYSANYINSVTSIV